MLAAFGYRVGKARGIGERRRRELLDILFAGSLPKVFPKPYLAAWGSPGSSCRLQKMANTIAALTRNARRRRNERMQQAIDEWVRDLEYLYKTYYIRRFSFPWPEA